MWDAIAAKMGKCSAIGRGWEIADMASEDIRSEYGRPDSEWDAQNIAPDDRYMHARIKALQDARAAVWDGSEYHADLSTTGDFFCAKFAVRAAILAEQEGGDV